MWNSDKELFDKLRERLGGKYKEAIIELINKQISYERLVDAINEFGKSAKLLRDAAFTASEAVIRMYPLKNIVEESPTSYSRGMDNCGEMTLNSDAVEHLRQLILVQSPCNVNGSNWDRIESQHEIANRNRHTSRHVPFYFSIVGQNRHAPRKDGKKYHTKFNRNVRPKGTHSHFKFYK